MLLRSRGRSDPAARLSAAILHLRRVIDGIKQNSGAPAILQTIAAPPQSLFGSLDRTQAGSLRAMTDAFNLALAPPGALAQACE